MNRNMVKILSPLLILALLVPMVAIGLREAKPAEAA